MPPKPALTNAERLKKELAAQRARAEALKHLQTTGSGPSQSELARQQAERQKLKNATSARVERFVTGGTSAAAPAADKYDPRVRDNTLHAVALRRANEIHETQRATQKLSAYSAGDAGSNSTAALPDGWTAVPDPASGDVYYWNESTNETSWDRPRTSGSSKNHEQSSGSSQTAPATRAPVMTSKDTDALPAGWEAVDDVQSGDVYYWNRSTNETSWTRPACSTVSLPDAIAAKSRLDGILKSCGPATASSGTKRALPSTTAAAATSTGSSSFESAAGASKRKREQ